MAIVDEQEIARVQALVLYAIVLHARHQLHEADLCIARAAKIALKLGLNLPHFARNNAGGDPIIEESLRRTWWELYTVDTCIAALHRRVAYETKTVKAFAFLPCSQLLYEAGACDVDPPSLQTFEERPFALDPRVDFSSHCYRIEAIRLIDRVTSLTADDDASRDSIQAVDNAIASWKYSLPAAQPDVIDESGEVDEIFFQAHIRYDMR
ncbi:hypothetical protein LTR53_004428 [Teratosphaeriaceae sp. CCFEE 6253]|nr:hypothetical protein LTR53_004428 [Teratosphaeriaceae sp. CCFEE 6253]